MANSPHHAVTTAMPPMRLLRALLALLVAMVSVLGMATSAATAEGPNNGTIKIDEETLTSDGGPSNNPKPLGCTFDIDFYNFPTATPTATISFENKSPGKGTYDPVSEADLAGPRTVTFATTGGPASVLEFTSGTYTVDPNGALKALPNGDILLKVTVELEGDRNFKKHKVFKLECLPAPVTPPAPVPDLAITKGGPDNATVGMAGSYTLGVQNVGTALVSDPIVVTDTLPAGVTPTTAVGDGFVCTIVGQLVTCTRQDDLAAGASTAPITVRVTFGAAAVPSVLNTARVTPVTGETVLTNNEDTQPTIVTVPVVVPPTSFDLAVDKSGPATATSGSSVTYAIDVVNNGPDASPGFVVIDELSVGQRATAVTAGSDYVCAISANGRTVTCTRAAGLANGASASTILVTVDVLAGPASTIGDTASVPALSGDRDSTNNNDTVTTTVPGDTIVQTPVQTTVETIVQTTVQTPVRLPVGTVGAPVQAPVRLPVGTVAAPAQVPVQVPVMGPPTGIAPQGPPTTVPLPDITGTSPNLPAVLPVQVPGAVPAQAPPGANAGAGTVTLPVGAASAAAKPATLPFTGSPTDTLLMTGLSLLLLGAGALVAAARAPKTAR